ncbi:MAG: hypothetical protein KAI24_23330 [Planctomycetes bacterium]|nr:hypothetical protein [Planctomycetota bacterium]
MMKLSSLTTLTAAGLLLAGSLTAQRQRLPGLPIVPPPVDHPALAGQPLMGNNGDAAPKARGVRVKTTAKPMKADPSTSGVKVKGKDLKKAVQKVAALPWLKLDRAKAESKKTGRPILLLQTLGEIDGFA